MLSGKNIIEALQRRESMAPGYNTKLIPDEKELGTSEENEQMSQITFQ